MDLPMVSTSTLKFTAQMDVLTVCSSDQDTWYVVLTKKVLVFQLFYGIPRRQEMRENIAMGLRKGVGAAR